jgi:hypothetical protein
MTAQNTPSGFTDGHALLIGVGGDLPVTGQDATALRDMFTDPARCAYPAEQVRLLTDGGARRVDILTALDALAETTDSESTVLIYFSGHGVEAPGYYLLPFGWDLADLTGTAINGVEFTAKLQAIPARKLLVLLDCCHAGGMADVKEAPLVKSPAPPGLFEALRAGAGRVVIASSRKDEISFTAQPYSLFTGALLEALAGYGAFEQDGYARVLDTALWVGRKVPDRSRDRQHPIVKVSNLEDNFALAYYAGGAKEPRKLDWKTQAPPIVPEMETAQMETQRRMLRNHRESLLLIEERMSEYVEFTTIPLQLVRAKRRHEQKIAELERELGGSA